jgi:hypothetical protein
MKNKIKDNIMTPIYDELHADWSKAIASAEKRAMLIMKKKILAPLLEIHRPTQKIKAIIKELELIK